MLRGFSAAYEVKYEYREPMTYPAVVNDKELFERAAEKMDKDEMQIAKPFMMAEDFSNFQRAVPGLYSFIGVGDPEHKEPLHSGKFDFNEQALLNGVEYFLRVIEFD